MTRKTALPQERCALVQAGKAGKLLCSILYLYFNYVKFDCLSSVIQFAQDLALIRFICGNRRESWMKMLYNKMYLSSKFVSYRLGLSELCGLKNNL